MCLKNTGCGLNAVEKKQQQQQIIQSFFISFFYFLIRLIWTKTLTFPRSFLQMRGDRKSLGSIESGFILTTGPCAGFCMLKNDLILITSVSYELSANERPFDARRQAAIHFAYWSSCKALTTCFFICYFDNFFDLICIQIKEWVVCSYIFASNPHFVVCTKTIIWRHFQFDIELALGQYHLGRYFAATQIDCKCWCLIATELILWFVQEQM